MKHDFAEEAFRAGRLSAHQSDHGLIALEVAGLPCTADGFFLSTDLAGLVEDGKSKIRGTADPARPHVLALRLGAGGRLEFRVLYVDPQQVTNGSEGNDQARSAAVESDARTHTSPLPLPAKASLVEPDRIANAEASASAEPRCSDGDAFSNSTLSQSTAVLISDEAQQAHAVSH